MTTLRQQMAQDLQIAGLSERTQEAYLRAVRQLADHYRQAPDRLSEQHIRDYFLFLKNQKKFAPASLKMAFYGIRYFYTHTVPREWETLKKLRVPKQKTLPDVLTVEEVRRLIDAVRTPHNKTYLWTVYSLGLRLTEGLHLQVGDVDSQRMLVHVHRGKGARDRYVPLPAKTLTMLREYWASHRNPACRSSGPGRSERLASGLGRPFASRWRRPGQPQVSRPLRVPRGHQRSPHRLLRRPKRDLLLPQERFTSLAENHAQLHGVHASFPPARLAHRLSEGAALRVRQLELKALHRVGPLDRDVALPSALSPACPAVAPHLLPADSLPCLRRPGDRRCLRLRPATLRPPRTANRERCLMRRPNRSLPTGFQTSLKRRSLSLRALGHDRDIPRRFSSPPATPRESRPIDHPAIPTSAKARPLNRPGA